MDTFFKISMLIDVDNLMCKSVVPEQKFKLGQLKRICSPSDLKHQFIPFIT